MSDLNTIPRALFLQAMQAALADELWKPFGFERRPRWTGLLFRPFMKEADRILEPALIKELYLLTQGIQVRVISQLFGRNEAHELTACLLQLVMRGPPGSTGLAPWTSFRLQDANAALSHITAGLRGYAATDGSPGQLLAVFRSHCPSSSVERRWSAGGTLLASRYTSALADSVRQEIGHRGDAESVNHHFADKVYLDCASYILEGWLPPASV